MRQLLEDPKGWLTPEQRDALLLDSLRAAVKELRERSGAGMMECKNALVATGGDLEAALEQLRKSGAAKAAKKASLSYRRDTRVVDTLKIAA